jgi:PIN domain nuclease of toxin-antitoxin system
MILLDTHMWVWWVNQAADLTTADQRLIERHAESGLALSMISCWEIAKKVELGRLQLTQAVRPWLETAISYPGLRPIDLSLDIMIESTQLPGTFHRDPADQLIVATARVLDIPLLTRDSKIRTYPHVKLAD